MLLSSHSPCSKPLFSHFFIDILFPWPHRSTSFLFSCGTKLNNFLGQRSSGICSMRSYHMRCFIFMVPNNVLSLSICLLISPSLMYRILATLYDHLKKSISTTIGDYAFWDGRINHRLNMISFTFKIKCYIYFLILSVVYFFLIVHTCGIYFSALAIGFLLFIQSFDLVDMKPVNSSKIPLLSSSGLVFLWN